MFCAQRFALVFLHFLRHGEGREKMSLQLFGCKVTIFFRYMQINLQILGLNMPI